MVKGKVKGLYLRFLSLDNIFSDHMDTLDIFDNSTGDDGQYEEELTAAEVLQKLEDAWLNEKHSPEILEPRMEIVECMLEQAS